MIKTLKIVDFNHEHIDDAKKLALANYEEERKHVHELPAIETIPDLAGFAENGLGVTAFKGNNMVGFLCCYEPNDNAFGSTRVKGIFSPMGGNAAVSDTAENQAKIYAAMYQSAGEKWVRAGAVSHAVCLYAHDMGTQMQFYRYGFGLRCVDAVRSMDLIECIPCDDYSFTELGLEDCSDVYKLGINLNEHQRTSPYFMNRISGTFDQFENDYLTDKVTRYFGAKKNNELCAYLSLTDGGETFIACGDDYKHINGAFCSPEHRGKGVYQNLLNHVIVVLKNEGITRLGTDFESFNPAGSGFWLKHFKAYTHSVVRRIDENILDL